MIAVFFAKSSHVAFVPVQERKTVKVEWHINTCLPKFSRLGVHTVQTTAPADCCSTTTTQVPNINVATLDYLEANHVQLVTLTPL